MIKCKVFIVFKLTANGLKLSPPYVFRHSFGEQFSQKKWTKEIAGQREILSAYGGVKQEDIRGMRAPFLAVSIESRLSIDGTQKF